MELIKHPAVGGYLPSLPLGDWQPNTGDSALADAMRYVVHNANKLELKDNFMRFRLTLVCTIPGGESEERAKGAT